MNKVIFQIRKELKQNIDLIYKDGAERFFKEEIKIYGVRYPKIREIIKKTKNQILNLEKKDILVLCEELLSSKYHEEAIVAFGWCYEAREKFTKLDFKIFEGWLNKYVTNWALCDDFSTHILNYYTIKYPETIAKIRKWTKSKNRWVRRSSAVSFLHDSGGSRPNTHRLEDVFWVADALLEDEDDMVQKGYGWLLKNTSKKYQKEVFEYVMKNKDRMPRTALRYAIEKMPDKLRKQAMEK